MFYTRWIIVILLLSVSIDTDNKQLTTELCIEVTRTRPSVKVHATYYNADPDQTDSNPLITADGSRITRSLLRSKQLRWIALSRDMLKYISYDDTIYVETDDADYRGYWIVKDKMNARYKKTVDFLQSKKLKIRPPHKVVIHYGLFQETSRYYFIRRYAYQN